MKRCECWIAAALLMMQSVAGAQVCLTTAPFTPTPANMMPGVDGEVTGMVEWRAALSGGSVPPMVYIGGTFRTVPSLGSVPSGLVAWDTISFREIPAPGPGDLAGPRLWCTWQPSPNASDPRVLVATTTDANGVHTIWTCRYNGQAFVWSVYAQLTGTINAITGWDANLSAGSPPNEFLAIGGSQLQIGNVGPTSMLLGSGTLWNSGGTFTNDQNIPQPVLSLQPYHPTASADSQIAVGGAFTRVNSIDAGRVVSLRLNPTPGSQFFTAAIALGAGVPGGSDVRELAISFPTSTTQDLWINALGTSNLTPRTYVWNGAVYAEVNPVRFSANLELWYPAGSALGPWTMLVESPGGRNVDALQSFLGSLLLAPLGQFGSFPSLPTRFLAFDPTGGLGTQPEWLIRSGNTIDFNGLQQLREGNVWLPMPNFQVATRRPERAFVPNGNGLGIRTATRVSSSSVTSTGLNGTLVGGDIAYAGRFAANNVAYFNGTEWSGVGVGFDGRVDQIKTFRFSSGVTASDSVFAIGSFIRSGATELNHIAQLETIPFSAPRWIPLSTGLRGPSNTVAAPRDMTFHDFDGPGPQPARLVVVGEIAVAGGVPVSSVAVWNNTSSTWSALGTITGNVFCVTSFDRDGAGPLPSRLVVGGRITSANGFPRTNIIEWDGVQWQQFPLTGAANVAPRRFALRPPAFASEPTRLTVAHDQASGSNPTQQIWTYTPASSAWTPDGLSSLQFPNLPLEPASSIAFAVLKSPLSIDSDEPSMLVSYPAATYIRVGGSGTWYESTANGANHLLPLPRVATERARFLASRDETNVLTDSLPFITSLTTNAQACRDGTVSLSVTADAATGIRWRRGELNLDNGPTATGSVLSGVDTPTLTISNLQPGDTAGYNVVVANACGSSRSISISVTLLAANDPACAGCDSIDFNNNTVFPEEQDVIDFFNVLAGGPCSPGNTCSDIDFNNNGVFPEEQDVIDFFDVLAGAEC